MACINIKNPEYIALSNSLSNYGLTNQGIIQAYIHEYQEETNSDNYPDVSYFKDEFIRVEGDIATEQPSLFIYKGDNLVGHVKLENTGDQLIEREVHVYTPGRGIGSFAYTKIAEMATTQGFQFRSDDQHSVAGTNLWEGLVRQDKAEKLNNVYYYKQQENKQSNQDQLSVIEPSNSIKEGYVRLYRSEDDIAGDTPAPDWVKESSEYKEAEDAKGRWFYKTLEEAQYHAQKFGSSGISYVDIPTNELDLFNAKDNKFSGGYGKAGNEYFLSKEYANLRQPINTSELKQSDITTNFEQYFPDYAYLNGDERQVFIKGIESGDITITCTK